MKVSSPSVAAAALLLLTIAEAARKHKKFSSRGYYRMPPPSKTIDQILIDEDRFVLFNSRKLTGECGKFAMAESYDDDVHATIFFPNIVLPRNDIFYYSRHLHPPTYSKANELPNRCATEI